jgi:hypothetical protein
MFYTKRKENYKTLLRENTKNLNIWQAFSVPGLEDFLLVKLAVSNTIPTRIPASFFGSKLKCVWKCEELAIAKIILKRKSKIERFILLSFKFYYKATLM